MSGAGGDGGGAAATEIIRQKPEVRNRKPEVGSLFMALFRFLTSHSTGGGEHAEVLIGTYRCPTARLVDENIFNVEQSDEPQPEKNYRAPKHHGSCSPRKI